MTELTGKKCLPCEGGAKPLTETQAEQLITQLKDWVLNGNQEITKRYIFSNFYKTVGFVNAIAWIANQENHHPDISMGYNYCQVSLKTHAIAGLSENDFIVAAKIDELKE